MSSVWLFARLTIREATRKKLVWALLTITITVIIATAFGFSKLVGVTSGASGPGELRQAASLLLILVMFAYSFVLGLSAVFMMAPSVAGELESGTALAILTRPVSRAQMLIGKWLGLAILITAYVTIASLAEFAVVTLVTDYGPPHPFGFIAYMVAEALVILTLSMLISTRLPPVAGGVIALGAFMVAWMGGVSISIGRTLRIDSLVTAGTVTRLLLPTDGMWKGAVYSLEPKAMIAAAVAEGPNGIANFPFFATSPPPIRFLAWTVCWVLALMALSVWSLSKREI
jgi:ABC-type transport system involved in multi-copper enzyme maturation permease subunit